MFQDTKRFVQVKPLSPQLRAKLLTTASPSIEKNHQSFVQLVMETKRLFESRKPQIEEALRTQNIDTRSFTANVNALMRENVSMRQKQWIDSIQRDTFPTLDLARQRSRMEAIPAQRWEAKSGLIPRTTAGGGIVYQLPAAFQDAVKNRYQITEPFRPPYDDGMGGFYRRRSYTNGQDLPDNHLVRQTGELFMHLTTGLVPLTDATAIADPFALLFLQSFPVIKGTRRIRISAVYEPVDIVIGTAGFLGYGNAEAMLHLTAKIPGYYPREESRTLAAENFGQEISMGRCICPGLAGGGAVARDTKVVTAETVLDRAVESNTEGYCYTGLLGWVFATGLVASWVYGSAKVKQIEVSCSPE